MKKKHSKIGDDSKYQGTIIGTIIGRGNDAGEIQVEGGPDASIRDWIANRSASLRPRNDEDDEDGQQEQLDADLLSPASSGLSSVGSRLGDEDDMDLS